MATIYNSTTASLGAVSAEILPARPNRTLLTITNLSTTDTAYLSLMDASVAGTGMAIGPGNALFMEVGEAFNESLNGITTGAAVDLSIEERYEDTV